MSGHAEVGPGSIRAPGETGRAGQPPRDIDVLRARAERGEAIARLGREALTEESLSTLLDHCCEQLAVSLRAEYTLILELLPDGRSLWIRSGHGWLPGVVGSAVVEARPGTLAEASLAAAEPIVVSEVESEQRFDTGDLSTYGVHAGLTAPIHAVAGRYGIVSALAHRSHAFDGADVEFISSVADLLSATIRRMEAEQIRQAAEPQFRAVFNGAIDAMLITDDEGRYVDANPAACALFGLDLAELTTHTVLDFAPPDRLDQARLLWDALRRGTAGRGRYTIRRLDGTAREVEYSATAGFLPGRHLTSLRDITERSLAEQERLELLARERAARIEADREAGRLKVLADAGTLLAESLDYHDILGRIARLIVPDLAEYLAVARVDGDGHTHLDALVHADAEREAEIRAPPPDVVDAVGSRAILEVVRTGRSQLIPNVDPDSLRELWADSDHRRLIEALAPRSIMLVPLKHHDRIFGALVFGWSQAGRAFSEADVALAEELARRAALSIENARLYAAERAARADAEAANRRLAFLARASSRLSSTLDYEDTLNSVPSLTVPEIADWCSLHVLDESGQIVSAALAHVDPQKVEWARELRARYPVDPNSPSGVANVLRTGKSELYEEVPDALLVASAKDGEHLRLLRSIGLNSAMVVPLTARGRTFGALTFVAAESDHRYGPDDLAFAEDLALRAGVAIDNARLYREVQRADRAKDEFMAMLGHELRNPLAAISNALHVMRLSGDGAARVERAREIVERQVQHQIRLVDDLLNVTRLTRGKITLTPRTVDLARLTRQTSEDHRATLEAAGLSLELELPSDPIVVEGDPTRLAQILGNLLQNAAKFTDPGGRVSVRAEVDPAAGQAVLAVRDTGIGLDPEILATVFDPFSQADRSLARSRGGLGLGLALVQGLVALHGGTVSARSAGLGLGAEFTVRLPLARSAGLPGENTSAARASIHAPPLTILVVEDNTDASRALQDILELWGHRVETAATGPDGIARALEIRPDVILCDIGLPEMDGYSVARAVRCNAPIAATRLIAISGYGQENDRVRSGEAGFEAHLTKPVNREELQDRLARIQADRHAPG